MSGSVGLQTVVAQGCRPIGEKAYTITEVQGNGQVISKLDGRPAIEVLQDVTNKANPEEMILIKSGLLCGISSADNLSQGDYLSRQIVGLIPKVGGLVVGATNLQVGDKFCFQVRDADIATKDLQTMVGRVKASRLVSGDIRPLAALQISCVARGRNFFDGVPNMDVSQVVQMLPTDEKPVVGGFFANGEIGPIGLSGGEGQRKGQGRREGRRVGPESSTIDSGSRSDSIMKPPHLHGFTTVVSIIYEKTRGPGSNMNNDSVVGTENVWGAWG